MVFLSLGAYFLFTVVYDTLEGYKASNTVGMNYGSFMFYFYAIFFAGLELMIDLSRDLLKKIYSPRPADLLRWNLKRRKYRQKLQEQHTGIIAQPNQNGVEVNSLKDIFFTRKVIKESLPPVITSKHDKL